MGHELSFSRADGRAEMIYHAAGGTPWHTHGVPITGATTLAEALEQSNLHLPLVLVPMSADVPVALLPQLRDSVRDQWIARGRPAETLGEYIERTGAMDPRPTVRDRYAVYRADTGEVLGTVGKNYHLVPQSVAFAPLEAIVDAGLGTIVTAGVLRGGADTWLQVDLTPGVDSTASNFVRETFDEYGVRPMALALNNNIGRRKLAFLESSIRVVCANTQALASRHVWAAGADEDLTTDGERFVKIRHDSTARSKIAAAAESMWSDTIKRHHTLARQIRLLGETQLTREQVRQIVEDIVPMPEPEPDAPRRETTIRKARERRDRLEHLAYEGTGQTGAGTGWEVLQGIIEAYDHEPKTFANRGGGLGRVEALTYGSLARAKAEATTLILERCAALADVVETTERVYPTDVLSQVIAATPA